MLDIEAEVREIKLHVIEISEKIDELMYEREITAMMKLAEKSLSGFFEDEPDIYKNPFASKSLLGKQVKEDRKGGNHGGLC